MSFNQMHFIIIKGQNSFRSDLERTKRRERRRNRKKQNAHWHILIRDGEMVRSKWYHNIHISVYIFFVYFTAYLVHTRRVIKYLRQMRANREVWAPEYKKKLTHTHTHEQANESEYGAIKRVKYLKLGQGYYINTFHLFKSRDGT